MLVKIYLYTKKLSVKIFLQRTSKVLEKYLHTQVLEHNKNMNSLIYCIATKTQHSSINMLLNNCSCFWWNYCIVTDK